MCGILGTTSKAGDIRKAAATFPYRGPDNTSYFEDGKLSFAHHRLSIIDIDPRANQPMRDGSGRYVIVFNGEIYNYAELRDGLSRDFEFKTESDTEVLLNAYIKYGKDMLPLLRGMYAFAIYDQEKSSVFLARDHAGIKPLFYMQDGGALSFASEVKGLAALIKSSGRLPSIDQEAIKLFSAFGYVPSPRTIVQGVRALPRSSWLAFDIASGALTAGAFSPKIAGEPRNLEDALDASIKEHIVADVPVGLFFSGGTDSSLIAALLHKNGANLSTWSIAIEGKLEDKRCFDGISKALGIQSNAFDFGLKEFDDIYEEVMSKIDEPTFDNSLMPTYFVSKKASGKVKVVLSGEGGDEYFMGYERMRSLSRMRKIDREVSWVERLFFGLPTFKAKNMLFKRVYEVLKKPLAFYLLSMSSSKDLMALESWKAAKALLADIERPVDIDSRYYLENDLLRKTDMATSYVSLEGRVPLLDPRVTEIARKMSLDALLNDGGKGPLKEILAKYVPKEFVYRKKGGFGMDLRSFFVNSKKLRGDLEKAVGDLSQREINLHLPKKDIDSYIERYPNYCFALITLYRAIKNTL